MSTSERTTSGPTTSWHRIDAVPDEGRVRSVVVDGRSVALTRCGGRLGALENHCPHQGGPLGEGSIEKGLLRCPWHGYDYDPLTGQPPAGLHRRVRGLPGRGARRRRVRRAARRRAARRAPSPTCWSRRWSRWGVTHVFGMVGHSNLGFADALRRAEERGELTLHRHPARGRGGVRGVAPTASSPAGRRRASRSPGPGSTNLLTGLYDAKLDRAPVLAISGQVPSKVLGRGAFQDLDLSAVFARRRASTRRPCTPACDHAELAALAVKHARRRPRRRAPGAARRGAGAAVGDAPAAAPVGRLRRPADRAADGGAGRAPPTLRRGTPAAR